jgi:hypothetical protein
MVRDLKNVWLATKSIFYPKIKNLFLMFIGVLSASVRAFAGDGLLRSDACAEVLPSAR